MATPARVNSPAALLANNVSACTRTIGARKPPMAPNRLTKPIPAASAVPDSSCVGIVQKTGCTAITPTAATHSAMIASTGATSPDTAIPTAAASSVRAAILRRSPVRSE